MQLFDIILTSSVIAAAAFYLFRKFSGSKKSDSGCCGSGSGCCGKHQGDNQHLCGSR